jgi:photosystem II stability/assembly factor-like uncharacterized protein
MRYFAFLLLPLALWWGFERHKTSASACAMPGQQPARLAPSATLLQSNDGGISWQDCSQHLPKGERIINAAVQDGALYLGAENAGLYHSQYPAMGPWSKDQVAPQLEETGDDRPNRQLSTVFSGPSGPYVLLLYGGIFRKTPGTEIWQPLHSAAMEREVVHSICPTEDGTLFIGAQSGIYTSTNGGGQWHRVHKGWTSDLVASKGLLLASAPQGLLRSNDGGQTWDCVLPDPQAFYQLRQLDNGHLVAIRPGGSWQAHRDGQVPLRSSTDGGQTWQPLDAASSLTGDIYDLKQAGKYLFCSHKGGISRSADGGQTWASVLDGQAGDGWYLQLVVVGETVYAVRVEMGC